MSTTHHVRPATAPIAYRLQPPGSKSITIRALTTAALAGGRSHLYGALRADDTMAMAQALRCFGVTVDTAGDPWTIEGAEGRLRPGTVDAGGSGLTSRVSLALALLAEGPTTVDGNPRLHLRPITSLVETIRSLGLTVTTTNGHLPATVHGQGRFRGGSLTVDASLSSQFATAMMLVAPVSLEPCTLRIDGLSGSAGYVKLTADVMEAFGAQATPTITGFDIANTGYRPADYLVEPDASAAVYPMVAAAITGGRMTVEGLDLQSPQPDITLADLLAEMGCRVSSSESEVTLDASGVSLKPISADMSGAPDAALALAVACLFAEGESRLSGLSSLPHKESDRPMAMVTEINRIGGSASVEDDVLTIVSRPLRPSTIYPHGDHRIAMAMALVGLRVPGIVVADPQVVDKTWPGYWHHLEQMATPR